MSISRPFRIIYECLSSRAVSHTCTNCSQSPTKVYIKFSGQFRQGTARLKTRCVITRFSGFSCSDEGFSLKGSRAFGIGVKTSCDCHDLNRAILAPFGSYSPASQDPGFALASCPTTHKHRTRYTIPNHPSSLRPSAILIRPCWVCSLMIFVDPWLTSIAQNISLQLRPSAGGSGSRTIPGRPSL